MKFSSFLKVAGVTGLTYWAWTQRRHFAVETNQLVAQTKQTKQHYDQLQNKLNHLVSLKKPVQQVNKKVMYRFRVYKNSVAPNIIIIQQQLESIQQTLLKKTRV